MTPQSPLTANQSQRLIIAMIVSAVILAVGVAIAPERIWNNLFVASYYLVTLGLGGALFIALAYATNAGWHVGFRRVPEAMVGLILPAGVVLLAVLAWRSEQYGWHHHGEGHDAGTYWFKELWATPSFWMLRAVAFVAAWFVLSRAIVGLSKRQDKAQGILPTLLNKRLSGLFLVVYAITFSLASIDWLMLLEPMWYSTIWGVYHFAGMFQATVACIIVVAILLHRRGPLKKTFTVDHLHDLAKLLLGFSCFWMYIWFSQYMLIWYTNIPEETSYFIPRVTGAWGPLLVASIVLNWVIPFFLLLPKPNKRNEGFVLKIAIVVLLGRWLDLYIMVYPSTLKPAGSPPVFGVWELAGLVLLASALIWIVLRSFQKADPVPTGDPLLGESLHYHA